MIKINHALETIQFDRIENRSIVDKAEKSLCCKCHWFSGENEKLNISKLERWILELFGGWS